MLYPQNGDRTVTIDSVTTFHPMYLHSLSRSAVILTLHWRQVHIGLYSTRGRRNSCGVLLPQHPIWLRMHILHPDNLRIVDITTLRHTTKGKKAKILDAIKNNRRSWCLGNDVNWSHWILYFRTDLFLIKINTILTSNYVHFWPFPTYVARSVIREFVCWAHVCAVRKRLKRSRCRLEGHTIRYEMLF